LCCFSEVGALIPGQALSGHHYDTLADAQKAGAATLNVGLFINAIIQFVIVSFAVFWIVKALTKINVRREVTAASTTSEMLLGEIRDLLRARERTKAKYVEPGGIIPDR